MSSVLGAIMAIVVLVWSFHRARSKNNETTAGLAESGYIIERPKAFYERIHTYIMTKIGMEGLEHRMKGFLPKDFDVSIVTDRNGGVYFKSAYWEAALELVQQDETRSVYSLRFPDFKVDIKTINDHATIESLNIVETAIERAVLSIDPYALTTERFATAKERSISLFGHNQNQDFLRFATPAGMSRKIADVITDASVNIADKNRAKQVNDKSSVNSQLLLMSYIGTPALPEEARNAEKEIMSRGHFGFDSLETPDVGGNDEREGQETSEAVTDNQMGAVAEMSDSARFCPSCGNQTNRDAVFCSRCGTEL